MWRVRWSLWSRLCEVGRGGDWTICMPTTSTLTRTLWQLPSTPHELHALLLREDPLVHEFTTTSS